MKLFFIVGEDSGDVLAAPIIKELKQQYGQDAECCGVGGHQMEQAGCEILLPLEQLSVIGLWEVLPKIPHLLKIKKALIEEIETRQPDALITVDFPDFNFIVAKELKKRGIFKGKIVHYVSPSVWAWRPGRAKKISQFLDGIMCLFPMEPKFYKPHGLKAEHIGHPLITTNAKQADGVGFKKTSQIPSSATTIGLFLGSRESEFKTIGPTLSKAIDLLYDGNEDIAILAPTLPKIEYDIQQVLQNCKAPVYVTANQQMKWESFRACDFAVAVSGTVALELAYAGVPHIIAYKVNPITAFLLKLLIKVKHVHLANILLEREVVPEFLQGKCDSGRIAKQLQDMIETQTLQNQQKQDFQELGKLLGEENTLSPPQNAVKFITETVRAK